ncbi:hypothetical protein BCR32DRAFT_226716 [Anaeromyces robustus]|uniref:CBM10 domain-containing protein n=1 Tax=Anaeromyces robustus TaxID=1754192 RepID=A0A1Y1VSF9_9FUNG|nr:hypothetical protein BCR32DRAFT_226716 [Anaeromyces robustus]|eukprot:ORX64231.1 hypothetical protein BCR32DRAFT_226716 [Anaeromyces robustus]
MKSYKVLILTAALAISNVSACIPDCWAEKLGYPCCKGNEPKVEFTDEHGDWSIENGQKCGILVWDHSLRCVPTIPEEPKKTEEPVKTEEPKVSQLYEICKEQHDVVFKDNEGVWSVENGNWCSIQYCSSCTNIESIDKYGSLWSTDKTNGNKCIINNNTCHYELYKNCRSALEGYMCCKTPGKVFYRDDFGSWGVENEQWCGFNEKYPCSWYKEKGYKCCTEIYNNIELREKLTPEYVSEQDKASNDGIFVKINGEVCGLPDNIFLV